MSDGDAHGVIEGPAAFRRMPPAWDPVMFIVTTAVGGRRAGCLVGFAMQASIDPPRMLVGISRENDTHTVAAEATALAIHCPPAGAVALAEQKKVGLEKLSLEELRAIHAGIEDDVFSVLAVQNSVKSRSSFGGTAPAEVRKQIRYWKKRLAKA